MLIRSFPQLFLLLFQFYVNFSKSWQFIHTHTHTHGVSFNWIFIYLFIWHRVDKFPTNSSNKWWVRYLVTVVQCCPNFSCYSVSFTENTKLQSFSFPADIWLLVLEGQSFVFELTGEGCSLLILEGSSFPVGATSPLSCRITQEGEPALLTQVHHLHYIQIVAEICHCHPSDMKQKAGDGPCR